MRQGKEKQGQMVKLPVFDPDRIKIRGAKYPYGARPDETETGGIKKSGSELQGIIPHDTPARVNSLF